jgi:hypothetical protein
MLLHWQVTLLPGRSHRARVSEEDARQDGTGSEIHASREQIEQRLMLARGATIGGWGI